MFSYECPFFRLATFFVCQYCKYFWKKFLMNSNQDTKIEMMNLKMNRKQTFVKKMDSNTESDGHILPKTDRPEESNDENSKNKKRDTSLPPLKYKFLEQMKHQISVLERDSPNIFTR